MNMPPPLSRPAATQIKAGTVPPRLPWAVAVFLITAVSLELWLLSVWGLGSLVFSWSAAAFLITAVSLTLWLLSVWGLIVLTNPAAGDRPAHARPQISLSIKSE